MAKGRGRKKRYGRSKPSILSLIPVGVLAVNTALGYQAAGMKGAASSVVHGTVGYNLMNNSWEMGNPYQLGFYGSMVGTYVAKKLVAATGANRALRGMPFRL